MVSSTRLSFRPMAARPVVDFDEIFDSRAERRWSVCSRRACFAARQRDARGMSRLRRFAENERGPTERLAKNFFGTGAEDRSVLAKELEQAQRAFICVLATARRRIAKPMERTRSSRRGRRVRSGRGGDGGIIDQCGAEMSDDQLTLSVLGNGGAGFAELRKWSMAVASTHGGDTKLAHGKFALDCRGGFPTE